MGARLFAYGTLQLPDIMEAVTGKQFPSEEAVLEGYESFLVRGQSYPALVRSPGVRTPGRLYTNVDRDSLVLLDRFEHLYERQTTELTVENGETIEAQVYVLPEKRRRYLSSQPWNKDRFLKEHFAEFKQSCRSFRLHEAGWLQRRSVAFRD